MCVSFACLKTKLYHLHIPLQVGQMYCKNICDISKHRGKRIHIDEVFFFIFFCDGSICRNGCY